LITYCSSCDSAVLFATTFCILHFAAGPDKPTVVSLPAPLLVESNDIRIDRGASNGQAIHVTAR